MKSIEDLKLVTVDEEVKRWIRSIHFEYQGEEQYVDLTWEEDYGYEILYKEFTPKFRKALDAWHETTDELFESMLDDITWQHVKKGN
jgi:hypothetical protein